MIDPLVTWQTTLSSIGTSSDNSWADTFAIWVDDRVRDKAALTGVTTATPPFTFNKAAFATELLNLSATSDESAAASNFADVWGAAINASLTLTVVPGDSVGAPTPATTWSSVTSALIDAASIDAAKGSIISDLSTAPPVSNPEEAVISEALQKAFTTLTGTITGLNSVTPTAAPLAASAVSLV